MTAEVVVPMTHAFRCDDYNTVENSRMQLSNGKLWDQFYTSGTEMIITKSGRRMFPSINVKISNLDPTADYCLFMEVDLAQRCRFKYSCSGGWTMAGHEESQSPHRIYMHPESPSKGSHWMNQEVSFSRVKLTNTTSPPPGQLVLSSMHKYQPKIILVKTSNPQSFGWAPTKVFAFPETQFIAVTAYQNEKITKLKIDHNPFAKGFRENGKSSLKRKQVENEGKDRKSPSPSPPPQEKQESPSLPHSSPVMPVYNGYYYPTYPFYNHFWTGSFPLYYQYPYRANYETCQKLEAKKPKKVTDFSINTIMNS